MTGKEGMQKTDGIIKSDMNRKGKNKKMNKKKEEGGRKCEKED